MTEKFEVIIMKEETCVKRHEVKESKTTKGFSKFMEIQEKNLEIKVASNDSKMLFVKMLDYDPDVTKIVLA
ncbi:hypothetical protein TRIUR3_08277 [Triticum urartu]|uniref:Uncharacterized protein n=1 Tax=Triticum urartu TaxID=4572 RepID=M7Z3K2_TRIUA|nr:hypothetical protein TRIUR3_08277 [Triticum urartu]